MAASMPVVSVRLVGCWGVILRILLVAVGTELFEPVWPHSVATGRASGSMFARAQTIVNTWPFTDATAAAWDVVRDGGSAIDAVVEGASKCENLQCDGTVGYGGSPDELGETTLDAMIIDGETMEMGAVGGIRNIKSAARAAALVKDKTKHSFLVGEQAGTFAAEMGLPWSTLTTQDSAALNRDWQQGNCQPNFRRGVVPDEGSSCGPYTPAGDSSVVEIEKPVEASLRAEALEARLGTQLRAHEDAAVATVPGTLRTLEDTILEKHPRPTRRCGVGWASSKTHDTIAMLALDMHGHIAASTSTNGNCGKIPGRVGDAAVVGAGAYARGARGGVPGGACGATGDGDVMMRFLPCYQAVENMRKGMTPTEAAEDSMNRILEIVPNFQGALVTMDSNGNHGAAAVGWVFHYAVAESKGIPQVIKINPLKTRKS